MSWKLFVQTADQTIADTVTETTMFDGGIGSLTLPANFFKVGAVIKGEYHGSIATAGTPTGRLRLKLGSTSIVDSGAVTLNAISGTTDITGNFTFICRSTGASGTVIGDVLFAYYASSGGGALSSLNTVPIAVTIDTTASQTINLTWEWGTASASNTISTKTMLVEVL